MTAVHLEGADETEIVKCCPNKNPIFSINYIYQYWTKNTLISFLIIFQEHRL